MGRGLRCVKEYSSRFRFASCTRPKHCCQNYWYYCCFIATWNYVVICLVLVYWILIMIHCKVILNKIKNQCRIFVKTMIIVTGWLSRLLHSITHSASLSLTHIILIIMTWTDLRHVHLRHANIQSITDWTCVLFIDPGDITCEPDEYAEFVKELRQSGIIKDHGSLLRKYKNSFSGKEFVDWVVKTKEVGRWYKLWWGLLLSHSCSQLNLLQYFLLNQCITGLLPHMLGTVSLTDIRGIYMYLHFKFSRHYFPSVYLKLVTDLHKAHSVLYAHWLLCCWCFFMIKFVSLDLICHFIEDKLKLLVYPIPYCVH